MHPATAFVRRVFAKDEDDLVRGCGVRPGVLEERGAVCSTADSMTGCDGMRSVAMIGGGVEADRCTCCSRRWGSGVRERPLSLSHFSWSVLGRDMSWKAEAQRRKKEKDRRMDGGRERADALTCREGTRHGQGLPARLSTRGGYRHVL